ERAPQITVQAGHEIALVGGQAGVGFLPAAPPHPVHRPAVADGDRQKDPERHTQEGDSEVDPPGEGVTDQPEENGRAEGGHRHGRDAARWPAGGLFPTRLEHVRWIGQSPTRSGWPYRLPSLGLVLSERHWPAPYSRS